MGSVENGRGRPQPKTRFAFDTLFSRSQFEQNTMAENTPNIPAGTPAAATPPAPPAPPKPGESGKIQPKKETVRINLPPKPTAAPTIKIPAPAAISAAAPAAAAAAAPAKSAAPPPPTPPAGGSKNTVAGAAGAPPAAGKAPAPAAAAPAPAPARPAQVAYTAGGLDMVDKVLAIAAAVVALAVLVRVFMLAS